MRATKGARVRCLAVALFLPALLLQVALGGEAPKRIPPKPHGGWMWTGRRDAVRPESGRRNHVFYVGDKIEFELGPSAGSYEVRDYWGTIVDSAPAGMRITVKVTDPGWYKLYVYAKQAKPVDDPFDVVAEKEEGNKDVDPGVEAWGDVVGGTMFVIIRQDANFPPLPAKGISGGHHGAMDEVMRGITGMGPQRHAVDAGKPDESIKFLEQDIAIDKEYYMPFDPVRKRVLMAAFPGGTKDRLDGVKKIVTHFKKDIQYWEPRNEPNYGSSGADFVKNEMKDFYDTVKSVDPNLNVMGPGTVSIGPDPHGLGFIEDFLKAGGGKYIDAFSFHAYNMVNGDLWLIRKSLDELTALLRKYGLENIEKWQTEQGYAAPLYGAYSPRRQGRWTMLQMLAYEQYGIPKEHNHLWYDCSHGFWDVPAWWVNEDGSLNPAAPLMRVYSEEIYGKLFAKAYQFGPVGDKLYLGNLYTGEGGSVAAFMSAGDPNGSITLKVNRGSKLRVVSAFGVAQDIPVKGQMATLPVPEMPVYVELAKGQTIEVVPIDYGPNLALAQGVTAATSGDGMHPVTKDMSNDIAKVFNGVLENWYYSQKPDSDLWYDNTPEFPAWIEISLPKAARISRVIVYSGVPWSWRGTLLDYELQYDQNGKWVTLEHVKKDPKTFAVFSPPVRCTVDCFFDDQWILQHRFAPVQTQKIRLLVHDAAYGGAPNEAFTKAYGQGPHKFQLREVEIYQE